MKVVLHLFVEDIVKAQLSYNLYFHEIIVIDMFHINQLTWLPIFFLIFHYFSRCKQGEIDVVIIATGVHTFFGKAAHLVNSTNQVGHFQVRM